MGAEHGTVIEHVRSAWRAYLPAIASFGLLVGGIAIDELAPHYFQPEWKRLAWYLAAYLPVGLPVLLKAIAEVEAKVPTNGVTAEA